MTEYTSLEVSRRLAEVGCKAEPDTYWEEWPDKSLGWSIGSYDIYATIHVSAYRSDTLLAWLLDRNIPVTIEKNGQRDYVVQENIAGEFEGRETLPDALAEVVLKVLEVGK